MSEDSSRPKYGYDPFATSGKNRWGRKGEGDVVPPEIPNYEIIDLIGAGGMGTVWSAKYIPLNQPRAIKILNDALAVDASLLERFAEEAKSLARLDHRFIVKVYDVSADPKCPYLSMDFIGGKPLSEILRTQPIPQDEALKYLGQVAEALDYAHGMGFLHRDIKPSNVLIANSGNAMLIDFGVANWLGGGDDENHSAVAGTTRYLSPEAWKGDRVTMASDIWSFAVLMYRVMTGSLPFDGRSRADIADAIKNKPPKEPEHKKRRVREYLVSVLNKDPKLRPKSATEMVEHLRQALKPAVTARGIEGIAVGTSLALFGAGVVVIAAAIYGYSLMRGSTVLAPAKTSKASKAKTPGVTVPSGAGGNATDVAGVWYGTNGNELTVLRVNPDNGGKFHSTWLKYEPTGLSSADADGSIGADSKVTFTESDSDKATKTTPPVTFTGQLMQDRASIVGKRKLEDGTETNEAFVRASAIPTTQYQDPTLNFSVSVPAGWQTTPGDSIKFSPVGQPNAGFIVSATAGSGIQEAFNQREQIYTSTATSGGSYHSLGMKSQPIAGKEGTAWEFQLQSPGGSPLHAVICGVLDGDKCVMVETWWPEAEADVWQPVLDGMRSRFSFTGD